MSEKPPLVDAKVWERLSSDAKAWERSQWDMLPPDLRQSLVTEAARRKRWEAAPGVIDTLYDGGPEPADAPDFAELAAAIVDTIQGADRESAIAFVCTIMFESRAEVPTKEVPGKRGRPPLTIPELLDAIADVHEDEEASQYRREVAQEGRRQLGIRRSRGRPPRVK